MVCNPHGYAHRIETLIFENMDLKTIINQVTVDCKDDGRRFTVTDRIRVIEDLLKDTDYKLLHKGNLCYIYGKKPVKDQSVILISSHIDCVYGKLFCQELEGGQMLRGTFDNSLTNACVLYDMIQGNLDENIVVAFTGDEEEDSGGVKEVARIFRNWHANIALAVVLDITEEGWNEQRHFTVENDLGINIMTGYRIVELLEKYHDRYGFAHDSEPDESCDYDEEDIPCFSLCIPSLGDMHGRDGVVIRTSALPTYCTVLSELANMLSGNSDIVDRVYYVEYEERGTEVVLLGIHADEDDCNTDEYVAIKEHNGQLLLPTMIHGKPVKGKQNNSTMSIKEILHQSLEKIFSEEIGGGYYLFVKRESGNMLIGSSPYGMGNIRVNGAVSSVRDFSMINPESINGVAIVSEYVTYWISIIDEDRFEILSGSNLLGRSTMNLLEISRKGFGKWTVEKGRGHSIIPNPIDYLGDNEMAEGVFEILADLGNPYQRDQEALCPNYHYQPNEYLIDVQEGVLRVNGNPWLHFPDF